MFPKWQPILLTAVITANTPFFSNLKDFAISQGYAVIAHGENVDDAHAHRPGVRAAHELGVDSPLLNASLSKADIRLLATELELPNAQAPSAPCLATRFPYNTSLTPEHLQRVENAETVLRDTFRFSVFRVRSEGDHARIEIAQAQLARAFSEESALTSTLRTCGFTSVTIDANGYRSGSFDG